MQLLAYQGIYDIVAAKVFAEAHEEENSVLEER